MCGKLKILKILIALICLIQSCTIAATDYEDISSTVEGLYNNNFDNFERVINLMESNSAPEVKADIINVLYDVMKKSLDTRNPLKAIPLYIQVVQRINTSGDKLHASQLARLVKIRDDLLQVTIIPQGSRILEKAIDIGGNDGDVVQLIDFLAKADDNLSKQVIEKFGASLGEIIEVTKLAEISSVLWQNIYILIKLDRWEMIPKENKDSFIDALLELKKHENYPEVPDNLKSEVEKILQNLITEEVKKAYGNDFDRIDKVIKILYEKKNIDDKVKVIVAIYQIMKDLKHLEDPQKADRLFEEIEKLIETLGDHVPEVLKNILIKIRDELISKVSKDLLIKQEVKKAYDQNFKKYDEVIKLLYEKPNIDDKVKVIVAIYQIMNDLEHLDDPEKARRLLKDVNKLLESLDADAPESLRKILVKIRDALNSKVPPHSVIKAEVEKAYDDDFDNLDEVIKLLNKKKDVEDKVKVIEAIYKIMNDLKHLDDPQKAFQLLKEVKKVIKTLGKDLPQNLKKKLFSIRDKLISKLPKGFLIKAEVEEAYGNDFENIDKVKKILLNKTDIEDKVRVLEAIYEIMEDLKHLDDPQKAIELLEEVNKLLTAFEGHMPKSLKKRLVEIRDALSLYVPKHVIIRKEVEEAYKGDPNRLDKVIKLIATKTDIEDKVRVLEAIHKIMEDLKHLDDPQKAGELLEIVNKLLKDLDSHMPESLRKRLDNIRNALNLKLPPNSVIQKEVEEALKSDPNSLNEVIILIETKTDIKDKVKVIEVVHEIIKNLEHQDPKKAHQLLQIVTKILENEDSKLPENLREILIAIRDELSKTLSKDSIIRGEVEKAYDKKFKNFYKVVVILNSKENFVDKVNVIVAIYDIMKELRHTDDPPKANRLIEEINKLLNTGSDELPKNLREIIIEIQNHLETVPSDFEIKEEVRKLYDYDFDNFEIVIDLLDTKNITDSVAVIKALYEIMKELKHLDDREKAAQLLEEVKNFLKTNGSRLPPKLKKDLLRIRDELISKLRPTFPIKAEVEKVYKGNPDNLDKVIKFLRKQKTTENKVKVLKAIHEIMEDLEHLDDSKKVAQLLNEAEKLLKRGDLSTKSRREVTKMRDELNSRMPDDSAIKLEVEKVFDNDPKNLVKVMELLNTKPDSEDKVKVLVAIHKIMHDLKLTDDPLQAIILHNYIAKFIKTEEEDLSASQRKTLYGILDALVRDTIVPKGSDMLIDGSKKRVGQLIDLMLSTDEEVTLKILTSFWKKLTSESGDPLKKITKISPQTKHSVYLFLQIHKMNKFKPKELSTLYTELIRLILRSDYISTVSEEHRRQVGYILSQLEQAKQLVLELYQGDFDNFDKVIRYMDDSFGVMTKANIIIALYKVMEQFEHTNDPFKAIPLYMALEERINTNPNQLKPKQLQLLKKLRDNLLNETIVPNGAQILAEAAEDDADKKDAVKLIDLLNAAGGNVKKLTLSKLFDDLDSKHGVPPEKIADITPLARQKLELLLSLYEMDKITDKNLKSFLEELRKLQANSTIPKNLLKIIENILKDLGESNQTTVAPEAQEYFDFIDKVVCFSVLDSDGMDLYLQRCDDLSKTACTLVGQTYSRYFLPYYANDTKKIKIGVAYYQTHLTLRPSVLEDVDGVSLNVFTESKASDDFYFFAQRKGKNQVVWSNLDKTRYLCGGNIHAQYKAYTRNAASFARNQRECIWRYEFCSPPI